MRFTYDMPEPGSQEATATLPDAKYVTVAALIPNAYCQQEDPSNSGCFAWRAGPVLGDDTGATPLQTIG
jgi:hypothetical protein